MDTYDTIRQAIQTKSPIRATYDGCRREACPHLLGTDKQSRPKVLLYQFAGESVSGLKASGSEDNWRCMFLNQLQGVSLSEGTWQSADNYAPLTDHCMTNVHFRA